MQVGLGFAYKYEERRRRGKRERGLHEEDASKRARCTDWRDDFYAGKPALAPSPLGREHIDGLKSITHRQTINMLALAVSAELEG